MPFPTPAEKAFREDRQQLSSVIEYIWRDVAKTWNTPDNPNWLIVNARSAALTLAAGCFGFTTTTTTVFPALRKMLETFERQAHVADIVLVNMSGECKIMTVDALHTCPYPQLTLARAHAILDSGGLLHLPINNFESCAYHLTNIVGENAFLNDPYSYHLFSRKKVIKLLNDAGFTLETMLTDSTTVLGMHYIARKQ